MSKNKKVIAIPPGETIKECLGDCGISYKEFAILMDMSITDVDRLLSGEMELTLDTAIKLETVLEIPSCFWNNLETIYRNKFKGKI